MYWTLTLLAIPIILIMAFKDQLTNTQLKNHIKTSLTKGKIVDVNKIQWKDALHYAQQEGKELTTIDNMISFYIYFRKEKIYILMIPISSGGISISAYKRESNNTFFS